MKTVPKSIWDVDMDDDLEYFGMINEDTYFVIYRPERPSDWDNFVVGIGPEDDLKQVEVIGGMRYGDGGLTVINTIIGTFFFPPPKRQDKKPQFNGKPIEVF